MTLSGVFWGSSFPLSEQRKNKLVGMACLVIGMIIGGQLFVANSASAATERRLSFYMVHTKETIDIVYKRDGKFIPEAIKKLNWFMRDWRRDQATKMDSAVYDLVWELRSELKSTKPTHVISGYRSLKTNNMLRRIGRRVARRSQHTKGRAIDLVFPDVPLARLRNNALVKKRGGVGFYPRSGKLGFVHVDTGRVRHWPRMGKARLASIFKDHKKKKKAKQILLAAAEKAKPATSPALLIASLSPKIQSALTSKIEGVTAPKPKSKPRTVIAAYRTAQLAALEAKRLEEEKATQTQNELLNRQDLQIQPASTTPQFANFATKSNPKIALRAGRLDDKPLVLTPDHRSMTTASVAPVQKEESSWLSALFASFRRDGQPQRFQVAVHDPEQPSTGDLDFDDGSLTRLDPVQVSKLNGSASREDLLRENLTPEQLARVAGQIVNRNGKTGLIRTRYVQILRPVPKKLTAQEIALRQKVELRATEAQPLSFQ